MHFLFRNDSNFSNLIVWHEIASSKLGKNNLGIHFGRKKNWACNPNWFMPFVMHVRK